MIYLGSDHAGFELKEKVKAFLENAGYEVADLGAFHNNANDDYPDFILPVANSVASDLIKGVESKGIVFGGSGEGEDREAFARTQQRQRAFYWRAVCFRRRNAGRRETLAGDAIFRRRPAHQTNNEVLEVGLPGDPTSAC